MELIIGIIFYIIIYNIIKYIYTKNIKNIKIQDKEIKQLSTKNYFKKDKLLTDNERLFYKAMREALKGKNIIIQTQVVLYEIIKTKNDKYYYTNFNKIKAKSIDFVLVDNYFNILLCIELDDNTHNRIDRKKRDEFINNVFEQVGIKLLRVPAQPYYSVERVKKLIEESL